MGALKLGPLRCGDPLNITTIREGIKRISRSRTSLGAALITNDPLPIRWRSGEGLVTPRGCEIRTPMTIYIYTIPSILVYDSTSKGKIIRMNFPLQIESQSDLSITTTPDIRVVRENLFKIHHIEQ